MTEQKNVILSREPYLKQATIYSNPQIPPRGCILYFHGGGLLYGSREDLPKLHIDTFTDAGLCIIAFDYPLAPTAKLDLILSDVTASINDYIRTPDKYTGKKLPYFLWGRSAGSYLCLIAAANQKLDEPPLGLLSYYGYGFLEGNWFNIPSSYYCSLPSVSSSCLQALPPELHAEGSLDTHYSAYVYGRQSGTWKSMFYDGREKFFFLDYSLRACDKLPCPLFCAHSINDTDVPYSEFLELCSKYNAQRFVASRDTHDFDRYEEDSVTMQLLETSVEFIENHLDIKAAHVKI